MTSFDAYRGTSSRLTTREAVDLLRIAGPFTREMTAQAPGKPIDLGRFGQMDDTAQWPAPSRHVAQWHGGYDPVSLNDIFARSARNSFQEEVWRDLHARATRFLPPEAIKRISMVFIDRDMNKAAVPLPHIDEETDENSFTVAVGSPLTTRFFPETPADLILGKSKDEYLGAHIEILENDRIWSPPRAHGTLWRDRTFVHAVPKWQGEKNLRRLFACMVMVCDPVILTAKMREVENGLRCPVPA